MSYVCQVCGEPVRHGRKKLVHRILRPDGNIAREIAVGADCKTALDAGVSIIDLKARHAVYTTPQSLAPLPPPLSVPNASTLKLPPPPVPYRPVVLGSPTKRADAALEEKGPVVIKRPRPLPEPIFSKPKKRKRP